MRTFDPLSIELRGTNLLEASAGTGKTYALTTLMLRLLLENPIIAIDRILAVTFTEAATAELKDRVRARLKLALAVLAGLETGDEEIRAILKKVEPEQARDRVQEAIRLFDEAPISTIHGFCNRVLRENAFESGMAFDMELLVNDEELRDEYLFDVWVQRFFGKDPEGPGDPLFYRYLLNKTKGPRSFRSLVKEALARPDIGFVPKETPYVQAAREYRQAYVSAREALQGQRKAVLALLTAKGVLNQNSYPQAKMEERLQRVEAYLEPEAPTSLFWESIHEDLVKVLTNLGSTILKDRTNKNQKTPCHPFFDACERLSETQTLFEQNLLAFKRELAEGARTTLKQRKAERHVLTFDDMLNRVREALRSPSGGRLSSAIRAHYDAALIDEFQDTDPIQYDIFRILFHDGTFPLFLIGDPKQSIYSFRGADVMNYQKAKAIAPDRLFSLEVNWRSDPGLLDAVQQMFRSVPGRRPFILENLDLTEVHAKKGAEDRLRIGKSRLTPFRILFVGAEAAEKLPITKEWAKSHLYDLVAGDISRLLASKARIERDRDERLGPGDIAVLVRKNANASRMQEALRRLRIHSVIWSGTSVFQTHEATEMALLLKAVQEPGRRRTMQTALATDLLGVPAEALLDLDENDAVWSRWALRFGAWQIAWQAHGFLRMFRSMLRMPSPSGDGTVESRLLGLEDGERRLTNLLHLAELMHRAALENHLGMAGCAAWLDRMRLHPDESNDDTLLRLESDERAVKIITIHKSKGLEFPVVYAPDLWDGSIWEEKVFTKVHDPTDENRLVLDLAPGHREDLKQEADKEQSAELMRVAYVALTRAKHHTTVVWGPFKDFEESPLWHLFHMAADKKGIQEIEERMRSDLEEIVEASHDTVAVEPISLTPGQIRSLPGQTDQPFQCRPLDRSRPIPKPLELTSFSRLAASGVSLPAAGEAEPERDELETIEVAELPLAWTAKGVDAVTGELPPGIQAGLCFHAIYEQLDFGFQNRAEIDPVVEEQLRRHGFDPASHLESTGRIVEGSLKAMLDPAVPGLCLHGLPGSRRLNEAGFVFPIAPGRDRPFSSKALAQAFHDHPGPGLWADYGERIAGLDFDILSGFLRGAMDLVFEHDGRYHLVDYKSNRLGSDLEAYAPDRLAAAMAEHHYVLQYHLYVTALDRYLAYRIPGYDYDTHMGNVYYLFIRGMSAGEKPGRAVFKDRPPRALIESLSKLVGRPSATRRAP